LTLSCSLIFDNLLLTQPVQVLFDADMTKISGLLSGPLCVFSRTSQRQYRYVWLSAYHSLGLSRYCLVL